MKEVRCASLIVLLLAWFLLFFEVSKLLGGRSMRASSEAFLPH